MTSPPPSSPATQWFAQVDGLRAVAIVLVLGFHLQLGGPFRYGWAGVQLFFVISGFVITNILLKSRAAPSNRYYKTFYFRRTLRIFPIYYLYIGCVGVAAALVLDKAEHLSQLPWYLLYLQTVPFVRTNFAAAMPVTAHTWSLAIEEQFYWLWPLTVRLAKGAAMWAVLTTMFVAAPIARLMMSTGASNPSYRYATLPVELDALAVGGVIALLLHAKVAPGRLAHVGSLVAVGGLTVTAWLLQGEWSPVQLSLLAVSCGGCVAVAVANTRALGVPLQARPVLRVGKLSYGLYLYHPLVFWVVERVLERLASGGPGARPRWLAALGLCVKLSALWACAEISWRFLEEPLLRLKDRWAPGVETTPSRPVTTLGAD